MITAAQLRKAAQLVDLGWAQKAYQIGNRFCPYGAAFSIKGRGEATGLNDFEAAVAAHNDAPDCTKDAAVMFLLLCAEAREHGDL